MRVWRQKDASFIVRLAMLKSTPIIGTILSWFLNTRSKNV